MIRVTAKGRQLYYSCCPEPFPDVVYTILMKRQEISDEETKKQNNGDKKMKGQESADKGTNKQYNSSRIIKEEDNSNKKIKRQYIGDKEQLYSFRSTNLILPMVIVLVLTVMTFLLPAESGEE